MKIYWIAAFVLFSVGCDQPPARNALENDNPLGTAELNQTDSQQNPVASDKTNESAKKVDAELVLKEAIAAAKADDKALFVHIGADW